jgi:SAM-dependent methyltransferase
MKNGVDVTNEPPTHLGGFVQGGDPDTWYPAVWDWVCAALGVRSVLDVGCGEGHSTKYFQSRGCEVLGIDGSAEAVAASAIPERHLLHDFTSGPFRPNRTFDLVWSCEFVEHVEERYSANFLETFRASDRYVIMTHAVPGQKGHHHVNCQPSIYWTRRLRGVGFELDYRLTRRARKLGHSYLARSGLVFVKRPSRRIVPSEVVTALLAAEWVAGNALRFFRAHGLLATLKRILRS